MRGDYKMSATTLRVIGFLLLAAAVVVAVLNLKRVANLGMLWLTPVLLILGLGLVAQSKRRR
jgi:hypothetical protein